MPIPGLTEVATSPVEKPVWRTAEFAGAAGTGAVGTFDLFTITGAVIVRLVCVCTETLVEGAGGGTVEVGITGKTATIIPQTVSMAIITGEIWHDAAPDSEIEDMAVMANRVIADGNDIFVTIANQNVTDGTLVFLALWAPVTLDGRLVAA